MELKQLLLQIIKSEIFGKELKEDVYNFFTEEICFDLIRISSRHDLSHIVATVISKYSSIVKDSIADDLKRKIMLSVYRDVQKEHALKKLCRILEQSKISYIPLKGAIIRNLYPETWMRTSCDIDVLVHKEDVEKAISELCKEGFVKQKKQTKHDYSLISPDGVRLELHYALTTNGCFPKADERLDTVWKYTKIYMENYHYRMTTEMLIFYHIAHMAKHFINGGCGIRPFIDLHLLRTKLPYDVDILVTMLKEAKIKRFYDNVLILCDVWFENNSHSHLTEQMEQYILAGGAYGNTNNSAMVQAARGESKITNLIKLVFLPYTSLEILYPKLKKLPILFPFYQVKRWLSIFNKSKREKIIYLVNARNIVLQDDVTSTKTLLYQLGLLDV